MHNNEQSLCEGELSIKECLELLKAWCQINRQEPMVSLVNSTKCFVLAEILINPFNCMYMYSYKIGKLSISQRRGIIKLIPNKDANLSSIKNWRPLMLLNCDYKIATKLLQAASKCSCQSLFPSIKPVSLETDLLKKTFV